jgi:hypothetical protein
MHTWMATAAAALTVATTPAAAQGQLDWIFADRPVARVGEVVGFGVGWSIAGSFSNGGGSNTGEPAPMEGWQEWVANWYWTETVSALSVDLMAGGQWFGETYSGTGGGASGSAGFTMVFDTPGTYIIDASGSWQARSVQTHESEIGTRTCWNTGDPEYGEVYLSCDSWSWNYPRTTFESDFGGSLGSMSVQVEVQAVPEPATAALWFGGLLALGGLAARRRSQATDTGTRRASAHISS